VRLETERLAMREFVWDDWGAILAYQRDARYLRYYEWTERTPEHWGQGYATEAACEMVRFGFVELGLHRIWSWCVADNVGSAHVLEKVGMRLEGRQRDKEHYKGRWWDRLLYAVLEDEWRDQQVA